MLPVRPSSRLAFALAWLVFVVTVVLTWRKVLALPDGDVTRLFIATVAGAVGLALLGAWLQDHERQQQPTDSSNTCPARRSSRRSSHRGFVAPRGAHRALAARCVPDRIRHGARYVVR